MKQLNLGLTLLLLLVLAACASVTPEPELETGVDEYGPYTVLSSYEEGAELTTQQASGYTPPFRRVEVRNYGSNRYGTFFIFKSGSNTARLDGRLVLTLTAFDSERRGKDFRADLKPWTTFSGNTGPISPTKGVPTQVCGFVGVNLDVRSSNHMGFERVDDAEYMTCWRD